jgi:hypothetical protein
MRRPCTFKKTDVTRAIAAVRAAGIEPARVEVDKEGKITVVPRKPGDLGSDEASDDLAKLI